MQLMRNPEVCGKEYQQGTLAGYETREYLLEKWTRQCAYCGVKDVPLQVEHIHPRAKGGTNSIINLTLSCEKCNLKKGSKDVKEFLKKDPTMLEKILKHAKQPLADAAAVNTTRFALLDTLKATGLPVETGTGGLTNKITQIFQENDPMGRTDLASVLKDATDNYFDRKAAGEAKPDGETILVITDGEPDDRKAVMKVIIEASQQLDRDEELGISLIQVGNDATATRFLKALDDELQGVGAKFDIVDTVTMDDMGDLTIAEVLLNAIHD